MALEELGRQVRNHVDAVVFFGIGGSYLGGKVLFDVQCGEFWNLKSQAETERNTRRYFLPAINVDSHKADGPDPGPCVLPAV